jgi:energy-coupling factor transport system substrate-specific component
MEVLPIFTVPLSNATLIFFNCIPLIPGNTELRSNNVIPLIFGVRFGPTGAWGAAFGNLKSDFFEPLDPRIFFGFPSAA